MLDETTCGKTVIVVADPLSTVAHLDRILVFCAGQTVADGGCGAWARGARK